MDSSLFFYFIFFSFFYLSGPFSFSFFFFFFFGGGGGGGGLSGWIFFLFVFFSWGLGVPLLPGWIHGPIQGYYQIILVVMKDELFLGKGTNHHYSLQYNKSEAMMWLSNFDVDIYNFIIDSVTLNSASYRTRRFL